MESMLFCDECDDPYHITCIDSRPNTIKEVLQWCCTKCLANPARDYGFEEGATRTLHGFQQIADDFKKAYFKAENISEYDAEYEFWNIVGNPYKNVMVEYAADLHTSTHGSGFPKLLTDPLDPYSKSAWNLNNIPLLPGCLLRNIRTDIPGMTVPWLYIGMVFSTFCWHAEDHFTYSINYHHWGETKTWYGIPSSDAEAFEDTMRKCLPELFDGSPDLLFHITTMLSPQTLIENKVKVFLCHQRPGDFVITFPKAYHAGFNQGFNCAEAVNFALPDWLHHGAKCVQLYKEFAKNPVFSHDQLVISISRSEIAVENVMLVLEAIKDVVAREIGLRKAVAEALPDCEIIIQEPSPFDGEQCKDCQSYCFISCVMDNESQPYCLEHAYKISPKHTLLIRYSAEDLESIVKNVERQTEVPEKWCEEMNSLLLTSRPDLRTLIQHLKNANFYHPERVKLESVISRCKMVSGKAHALVSGYGNYLHTIEDINNVLLESRAPFNFTSPEIEQLSVHFEAAKKLLTNIDRAIEIGSPTAKIKHFMQQAADMRLKLRNEESVRLYLSQMEWYEEAESENMGYTDIKRLLHRSRQINIDEKHPSLVALYALEHRCKSWIKSAEMALKSPHLYRDLIPHLVTSKPNEPTMLEKLNSIIKRSETWMYETDLIQPSHMFLAIEAKPKLTKERVVELLYEPVTIDINHVQQFKQLMAPVVEFYRILRDMNFRLSLALMLQIAQNIKITDLHCICNYPSRENMVISFNGRFVAHLAKNGSIASVS
jgi:JmjC domain, hydroxylase/PLU-1-like protein/C5HC2 zinc finger